MPNADDILNEWRAVSGESDKPLSKGKHRSLLRKIRINHYRPSQRQDNRFRSSPYTPWNFIPLFFKSQLSKPSNDIFIVIMILNYMPGITIVSRATAVIPVVFILGTSLLKDLVELGIRTRNDRTINKEEYADHISNGSLSPTVEAQSINPGDIFKIRSNQTAPCDVLILASETKTIYFSQSSLTGEQNLVQKKPIYHGTAVVTPSLIGTAEFCFQRNCVIGCYTGPAVEGNLDGRIATFPEMPVAPVSVCIEDICDIQRARERTYKNAGLSTRAIPLVSAFNRSANEKTVAKTEPILHSILFNHSSIGFRGTRATTDYYALALATGKQCFSTYAAHKKEEHTSKSAKRLQVIIIVQCLLVLVFVVSFSAVLAARYQTYADKYPYLEVTEQFASKGAAFFISFVSYLILFSYALPICIFVTIELLNILNRIFLRSDLKLSNQYGVCNVNNDKMLAELSRVSHIFTDKTGTLTCNRFIYNAFLGQHECVQLVSEPHLQSICALNNTGDLQSDNPIYGRYEVDSAKYTSDMDMKEERILQMIAIGLCNSLIPLKSGSNIEYFGESVEETCYLRHLSDNGILQILERTNETVKLAVSRQFIDSGSVSNCTSQALRSASNIVAGTAHVADDPPVSNILLGESESHKYYIFDFSILKVYSFDPTLKRMSVLCQHIQQSGPASLSNYTVNGGRPFLITKGSYNVMKSLMGAIEVPLREDGPYHLDVEKVIVNNLADKRCFVFSFKPFSAAPDVRTETQFTIEKDSRFLGISVIEDELAPHIFESTKKLKAAGIKMNIVTGDSIGTTIEVAKRTGIIDSDIPLLSIATVDQITEYSLQIKENPLLYYLVLTNSVITDVLPNVEKRRDAKRFLRNGKLQKKFLAARAEVGADAQSFNHEVAEDLLFLVSEANACLFCNMTPESKKMVVQYHSAYSSMYCSKQFRWHALFQRDSVWSGASLAIGDGQNDLQMIDAADVSVGVRGREGVYAANNADISVPTFSTLIRLLLVQGTHIEQRIRMTIFYNLYKNTMLAIMCGFYSGQTLFSSVIIINDFLSLMYNVILNFIPIFVYSISEQHIKGRYLENCPKIYIENRQPWRYWAEFLSFYTSGIYMAVVIYFCTKFAFASSTILGLNGRVADTSIFSFIIITAIIFVSLLRLMLASNYYTTAYAWSIIISIVLYYLTLVGINYTFFFTESFYNTLIAASASFNYYIQCLILITLCMVPDVLYWTASRLYLNPDPNSLLEYHFSKETKGRGKRKDIQYELRYQRCLGEVIKCMRTSAKGTKEQAQNALFCEESVDVDVKQLLQDKYGS